MSRWHLYRPRPVAGTLLVLGALLAFSSIAAGAVVWIGGALVWRHDVRMIRAGWPL